MKDHKSNNMLSNPFSNLRLDDFIKRFQQWKYLRRLSATNSLHNAHLSRFRAIITPSIKSDPDESGTIDKILHIKQNKDYQVNMMTLIQ